MTQGDDGVTPSAAFNTEAATADSFVERILYGMVTGAELRIAVVTAVEGSGDYRVKTSETGADFWCASLDSSLRINDRVMLLKNGPTYIAAGRLNGGGGGVPIATVVPYAGGDLPAGWLVCDGSAVSRTDYANLFASLGTSYGGGNGSSTFNLPNLADRTPLGSGSRGRGATGGAESVTLSQSQMPSHSHSFSGSGSTTTGSSAPGTGSVTVQSGTGATVAATGSHTHSASVSISGTTGNTGGASSVNIMSPYQVLTYIIKAR